MSADIVPRPAVEHPVPHRRRVIEWSVLTEIVALVDGAPGLAAYRLNGEAGAIAQPGGHSFFVPPVGIIGEKIGPPLFRPPGRAERMLTDPVGGRRISRHVLCVIRVGADRQQQAAAARNEADVARVMMRRGDIVDDRLGGATRFYVAALVRKADDAVAVGHIYPFGAGPERVERDAERLMQPASEDLVHR